MNDFLLKPFRPDDLSAKIASWLPDAPAVYEMNKSAEDESTSVIGKEVTGRLEQLEEDYGKEMVLKIVEMFVPDAEVRLEKIDRAIKHEDFKALEESAHG